MTVSTANVAPATRSITALALNDATVTLTIGTAVKAGQTVTVDYADPTPGNDANAVQDPAGNDAAALSARAVTNTVAETATGAALSMGLSSPTLTEGGSGVTATVTIAAGATFATDRAVALAWGGEALAPHAGLIREPSGQSRVLIAAGESTGTTTLVGVERAAYTAPRTEALTAAFDGSQIGSTDLTYTDSGAAPTATIAATPAMLAEGEDITVTVTLSRAFDATDVAVPVRIGDTENVLTGTPAAASIDIPANETTGTVTLSTEADMMTGADADVVFTLAGLANAPFTLGTPSTVTVDRSRRHLGVERNHPLGQPGDGRRGRRSDNPQRHRDDEPGRGDDRDHHRALGRGRDGDGDHRLHRDNGEPHHRRERSDRHRDAHPDTGRRHERRAGRDRDGGRGSHRIHGERGRSHHPR